MANEAYISIFIFSYNYNLINKIELEEKRRNWYEKPITDWAKGGMFYLTKVCVEGGFRGRRSECSGVHCPPARMWHLLLVIAGQLLAPYDLAISYLLAACSSLFPQGSQDGQRSTQTTGERKVTSRVFSSSQFSSAICHSHTWLATDGLFLQGFITGSY